MWGFCVGSIHVDLVKIAILSPWAYSCIYLGFQLSQNYCRLFKFLSTNHSCFTIPSYFSIVRNKFLKPDHLYIRYFKVKRTSFGQNRPVDPQWLVWKQFRSQNWFFDTWNPTNMKFQADGLKLTFSTKSTRRLFIHYPYFNDQILFFILENPHIIYL